MNEHMLLRYISSEAIIDEARTNAVQLAVRKIEPKAFVYYPQPGQLSGCFWGLYVNKNGEGCGFADGAWPSDAEAMWRICLSYRGPFLTGLSWSDPEHPPDDIIDPRLVSFLNSVANELEIFYVDSSKARSMEVSWDHLNGDESLRLDWSDRPNAFNLMFYEY